MSVVAIIHKREGKRLVARTNRTRESTRTFPPKLDDGTDLTEPSVDRRLLKLLKSDKGSNPSRNAVGFEAVKEAREGAAQKARKASTGQVEEAQSYPTGTPMILPAYTRPYYYSRRNREPESWNGWPTLFHQ